MRSLRQGRSRRGEASDADEDDARQGGECIEDEAACAKPGGVLGTTY